MLWDYGNLFPQPLENGDLHHQNLLMIEKMSLNCKNLIIYLFITIGIFSFSTISASEPPEAIEFEGSTLMLNGKGTRVVFFMKVYEGSLYLESKSSDAD